VKTIPTRTCLIRSCVSCQTRAWEVNSMPVSVLMVQPDIIPENARPTHAMRKDVASRIAPVQARRLGIRGCDSAIAKASVQIHDRRGRPIPILSAGASSLNNPLRDPMGGIR